MEKEGEEREVGREGGREEEGDDGETWSKMVEREGEKKEGGRRGWQERVRERRQRDGGWSWGERGRGWRGGE